MLYINEFWEHAGLKINMNKTEWVLLGNLKSIYRIKIKITNKADKYQGTYNRPDPNGRCANISWKFSFHILALIT